jgi:hypothetical protein
MRYVVVLVGALLISAPALAQTQQAQPTSGTTGSLLSISLGTIAGMYIGNYVLGASMVMNLAGNYAPQIVRYGSYGIYRPSLFGGGLIRTAVLIGSGILGGYVANAITAK